MKINEPNTFVIVTAGGGPLTPLGEKFKANGDKMPK
jgi:hypothetical protein